MDSRLVVLLAEILIVFVILAESGPVALRNDGDRDLPPFGTKFLVKRSPTTNDRPGCVAGAQPPPNRVDTSQRLSELRQQFNKYNIAAYIITSDNAHQGEEVAPHDHRRQYISGFKGSAGTAVVTKTAAALWTDGRYFLQAEDELDCNWILMKQDQAGVPNITSWLKEVLTEEDIVAADPTLIGAKSWLSTAEEIDPIVYQPLPTNLIDEIWTTGRPEANKEPGFVLHLNYSGVSWQDKVASLRNELKLSKLGADALVITALDEVAWLLNIRGYDVPNHPVLLSYMYVSADRLVLFAETTKVSSPELNNHLKDIEIRPYNNFITDLPALVTSAEKVLIPSQFVYTGGSSYAVYNAIPEAKRLMKTSPVLMMKAKKNDVEANGMMNAHLKDAVALCDFISQIAEEIPKGIVWDELKVGEELLKFRQQQQVNRGASFGTIAGYGPNGAIIHYSASTSTNRQIGTNSLLLLDSGGQYYDGTTDVTRTLHFGTPDQKHIEAYTRVLMGHVDLARVVFPKTTRETRIDVLAREPLFEKGLDYLHGTGHGIGHFGSIHESPTRIAIGSTVESIFEENYFFSDEPGYYKSGDFGIRIESILRVVSANFSTEFSDRFYRFEPATLVPFERKLIAVSMLSSEQIAYINDYYKLIRSKVGTELAKQGRNRAYDWLVSQTEPLEANVPTSSAFSVLMKSKLEYLATISISVLIGVFLSNLS